MKKFISILIVLGLLLSVGCQLDFPTRAFENLKNEVVLKNINTQFQDNGISGELYRFQPNLTSQDLEDINAVEMRIINSLKEEVAYKVWAKAGAAVVVDEEKGATPDAGNNGWGNEKFNWTPTDKAGHPIRLKSDSYKYILTIYDGYQEATKGKYTFKGVGKRTFVAKFDIVPAAQLNVLSVAPLKAEQDSGIANNDAITNINSNFVFRGYVNLDATLLEGTGYTQADFENPNSKIILSVANSNKSVVYEQEFAGATGNATQNDFADVDFGEIKDFSNFRFYSWTCDKTLIDDSWSLSLKFEKAGNHLIESPIYRFTVDTKAPIVVWSYKMQGEKVVENADKTLSSDLPINEFPTVNWDVLSMEADQTEQENFINWSKFKFLEGGSICGTKEDSSIVKGTNFKAKANEYGKKNFGFDPWCEGVQELEVVAYDAAGNKAIAKEGVDRVVRRMKVLPAERPKAVENPGFEAATGFNGAVVEDNTAEGQGSAPGWMIDAHARTWIIANRYNIDCLDKSGSGIGPFTDTSNEYLQRNICIGTVSNVETPEGQNAFKFWDVMDVTSGISRGYSRTWGTLSQKDFVVARGVKYRISAQILNKNGRGIGNPTPTAKINVLQQAAFEKMHFATEPNVLFENNKGLSAASTKNAKEKEVATWETVELNFYVNMPGKVDFNIEKCAWPDKDDGGMTLIDNVKFEALPLVADETLLNPTVH